MHWAMIFLWNIFKLCCLAGPSYMVLKTLVILLETELYQTTYILTPELTVRTNLMVNQVADFDQVRHYPYSGFTVVEYDTCTYLQYGLDGLLDSNEYPSTSQIRYMYNLGKVGRISYANRCNGGILDKHSQMLQKFSGALNWKVEEIAEDRIKYVYTLNNKDIVHLYGNSNYYDIVSFATTDNLFELSQEVE